MVSFFREHAPQGKAPTPRGEDIAVPRARSAFGLGLLLAVVTSTIPIPLGAQGSRSPAPAPGPRGSRSMPSDWRRAGGGDRSAEPAPSGGGGLERPVTAGTDDPAASELAGEFTMQASERSRNSAAGFTSPALVWRDYDLAPYSSRAIGVNRPEQSVVDWILKQTGRETWHGEDPAVLSAARHRLRIFHRPDIQAQVAEMVRRFTRPAQQQVSVRVQFVRTTDLSWRDGLAHLLKPSAVGREGQHVWLLAPEDASLIRNRLRVEQQENSTPQLVLARNGLPTTLESGQPVNYISGLELRSGLYLSYQPVLARLEPGIQMTMLPLWTTDGTAVDLELKLSTRTVLKLHAARSAAPLSTGNQETIVQVPEVAATILEQDLRWPVSQVLLISAGVQPARPSARRGPFGIPGPSTELLVFAELDAPVAGRSSARREAVPDR